MGRTVTFHGKQLVLLGRTVQPDAPAPDFRVSAADLTPRGLGDFRGKVKVITFFPSLDTPVCDAQVQEFNRRAAAMGQQVVLLGISKDLPFAQQRFCRDHAIERIQLLSDYHGTFGINYGVLIKELNLLARGACIIDAQEMLRFFSITPEVTEAPDYAQVLRQLEAVLRQPAGSLPPQQRPHCRPCEGGAAALAPERVRQLLLQRQGWELKDNTSISKQFRFPGYAEAKTFLDLVAQLAQEQGHHPTMTLGFQTVRVSLTTHAAQGLTENDFAMAQMVDELGF